MYSRVGNLPKISVAGGRVWWVAIGEEKSSFMALCVVSVLVVPGRLLNRAIIVTVSERRSTSQNMGAKQYEADLFLITINQWVVEGKL